MKINEIRVGKKINVGNFESLDLSFTVSVEDTEQGNYKEVIEDTSIELYKIIYDLRKKALKGIDEGFSVEEVKAVMKKLPILIENSGVVK